jgi:hypothetical protein
MGVMKRLVLMMMVVLAMFVQAVIQADNPSSFYLSPIHPPSLTPFLPFPPTISLSPYNDARSKLANRSNRQKTPKINKPNPGPYKTELSPISKLKEAHRT